jgi:tRNA1Val (adenine37-N6)-methyltransferase
MNEFLKPGERLDDLQRNGYRIIQNPEKFCFGMDAVLLAGFAGIRPSQTLLDLGTGTGILPLLMEGRYGLAQGIGLEIQEESAEMAARSVALNHLEERIQILHGDIKEVAKLFPAASFDVVTSNPPYMAEKDGLKNPSQALRIARHEVLCSLEDVVQAAAYCLKEKGKFFMVHRPARLGEIFASLKAHRLEVKRMCFVYPYVDKEPNMVLLEALKGGNPGMRVEKPLIVYREPGRYTQEIYDIYGY